MATGLNFGLNVGFINHYQRSLIDLSGIDLNRASSTVNGGFNELVRRVALVESQNNR